MTDDVSGSAFQSLDPTFSIPPAWPKTKSPLTERFTYSKEIGRGGFGRVFEASDNWLANEIALKISATDDQMINEVTRLRSLPKQYYVQVFDYGRAIDTSYFTMELLHADDGWFSLQQFKEVMQANDISPNESALYALFIIQCVCYGLTFLHNGETGYFHGDIKPQNIFFNINAIEEWKREERLIDTPFVKIIDLGICGKTGTKAAGFTRSYAPPEQKGSRKCNKAVDAFAVGMVLAQLMLDDGADGVSVGSIRRIRAKIDKGVGPYLRSKIADIIARMTPRQPQKRIACETIGDELHDFFYLWCGPLEWNLVSEVSNAAGEARKTYLSRVALAHLMRVRARVRASEALRTEAKQIVEMARRNGLLSQGAYGFLEIG